MDFFGVDLTDWNEEPFYLPFYEALIRAINKQPDWNPERPHTKMARNFLDRVRKYVSFYSPFSLPKEKIGLYCALGTEMDLWHGTDGFFLVDIFQNIALNPVVTIDLKFIDNHLENGSPRGNHFIVPRKFFGKNNNGERRLDFLSQDIAISLSRQISSRFGNIVVS